MSHATDDGTLQLAYLDVYAQIARVCEGCEARRGALRSAWRAAVRRGRGTPRQVASQQSRSVDQWYRTRLGYAIVIAFRDNGECSGVWSAHPRGGPMLALVQGADKARAAAGFDVMTRVWRRLSVNRSRADDRRGWRTPRRPRRRLGCRRACAPLAAVTTQCDSPITRLLDVIDMQVEVNLLLLPAPGRPLRRDLVGAYCTPMIHSPSTTMLCQSSSRCTVPPSSPAQKWLSASTSAASNTTMRRVIFMEGSSSPCGVRAFHLCRPTARRKAPAP